MTLFFFFFLKPSDQGYNPGPSSEGMKSQPMDRQEIPNNNFLTSPNSQVNAFPNCSLHVLPCRILKFIGVKVQTRSWHCRQVGCLWLVFPGDASGKESSYYCRRHRRRGSLVGREDALEKETATHSSVLAWRIPWTEEPGGLQSMGSHRVGYDCSDLGWGTSEAYLCLSLGSPSLVFFFFFLFFFR